MHNGYILQCCYRTFAAFVGYFIVGAVFLRVRHNKSRTDLIINKAFWKDFPFLVKVCMHVQKLLCTYYIHITYIVSTRSLGVRT